MGNRTHHTGEAPERFDDGAAPYGRDAEGKAYEYPEVSKHVPSHVGNAANTPVAAVAVRRRSSSAAFGPGIVRGRVWGVGAFGPNFVSAVVLLLRGLRARYSCVAAAAAAFFGPSGRLRLVLCVCSSRRPTGHGSPSACVGGGSKGLRATL